MTRYHIHHTTTYEYTEPVSLCQNVAHLTLRNDRRTTVERKIVSISPQPAFIEERKDYFGNPVHYFTIQEPHRELKVDIEHGVQIVTDRDPGHQNSPPWETIRDRMAHDISEEWIDANQFAFDSRHVAVDPRYQEYAERSFTKNRPILEAALDLMQRFHSDFTYDPKATTIATPVAEVFETRRGVCQDFAHCLLSCFRSLGLSARYISGYLSTQPPPGRPRLVGADATHAWVSLFCGELGWIDLDQTNNQIPAENHILLAWGRDYDDVSPLKGVILGGGQHVVKVAVDVVPC
ncbi:MAG: transglutaminase family protein [Gemmataceae bacterium]